MSTNAITTKGPGDLWHPPEPSADELALDEFVARLCADGGHWAQEMILDFLCYQRGPISECMTSDEWMETLQLSHAYLPAWNIPSLGYRARDPKGGFLMQFPSDGGAPRYRVDMQDLVSFRQAAAIAQAHGMEPEVDVDELDRLIARVAYDCVDRWLDDPENVRKLMEVC